MAAKPQFSLRLLLLATAAVALIAGEAVAFPVKVAGIVGLLVTVLLPAAFMAGIVYAPRFGRAFSIGALVSMLAVRWFVGAPIGIPPNTLGMMPITMSLFHNAEYIGQYRLDYCLLWSIGIAGGLVAIVVCWTVSRTLPVE